MAEPLREQIARIVTNRTGDSTDALNVADEAIEATAGWLDQRSRKVGFAAAVALRVAAKVLAKEMA